MIQMPKIPIPIDLNHPFNPRSPEIVPGEFWGIPDELLPRPEITDSLLAYLTYLEARKLDLRVPPLGAWRRCLQCAPQRPENFNPQIVYDKGNRDVWDFSEYSVVVKENKPAGSGGNGKEAYNDSLYQEQMRGTWVHFPVWGITPGNRFLIMARADDIPFRSGRENPRLEEAIERYAKPFISDYSLNNLGVLYRSGQRFWASVDLGSGSLPII